MKTDMRRIAATILDAGRLAAQVKQYNPALATQMQQLAAQVQSSANTYTPFCNAASEVQKAKQEEICKQWTDGMRAIASDMAALAQSPTTRISVGCGASNYTSITQASIWFSEIIKREEDGARAPGFSPSNPFYGLGLCL